MTVSNTKISDLAVCEPWVITESDVFELQVM